MAKRGPKPKGELGYPYYEGGDLVPVPREHVDLCERRVGFLTEWHEAKRPLRELLANAYWCGVSDTVEAYMLQGVEYSAAPVQTPTERDWIDLTQPKAPRP